MCAMQKCIIIWLGKWNWYYKFNAIIWMTVVNILKNWKRFKERLNAIHCAAFIGGRMLMYLPFHLTKLIFIPFICVYTFFIYAHLRFANCEHNNSLCLWPWQKPKEMELKLAIFLMNEHCAFFFFHYLQCNAFEYCQMIFCLQSINS